MSCGSADSTVHGYFDGELDPVRAAEFERHLEGCTECQATLEDLDSLRGQLRAAKLYERASPRLRAHVTAQLHSEQREQLGAARVWQRYWPVAFAVAAALLFAAALFAVQRRAESTRLTAELLDAHVRSLQPGHLTDVQSTDQHTVKPWFDGKLDFIPPVTDFSAGGFPLMGGRMDVIEQRNVAALVYARRKHLINVFVWPSRENPQPLASGSARGYNWHMWRSGDMEFCAVSDAAAADLQELQRLMER